MVPSFQPNESTSFMPQLSATVLKDSANVDHTFTPESIENGVAALVESTGVPLGNKRITIGRNQTAQGRRKVTIKLSVPTLEDAVVNGVTRSTVTRVAYCDISLSFDGLSTSLERKNVLAYARNLLAHASVISVAGDLEGLY